MEKVWNRVEASRVAASSDKIAEKPQDVGSLSCSEDFLLPNSVTNVQELACLV